MAAPAPTCRCKAKSRRRWCNRLPLRVGLYLEPALVQYVFEEKIQDHGDWRVEVGPMQAKLFRQVASAMFIEAVPVDSVTSPGANLDAVLAPSIVEFQISIPSQTRSDSTRCGSST